MRQLWRRCNEAAQEPSALRTGLLIIFVAVTALYVLGLAAVLVEPRLRAQLALTASFTASPTDQSAADALQLIAPSPMPTDTTTTPSPTTLPTVEAGITASLTPTAKTTPPATGTVTRTATTATTTSTAPSTPAP